MPTQSKMYSWRNPSPEEIKRREKQRQEALDEKSLPEAERTALALQKKEEKEKRIADEAAKKAAEKAAKQADMARMFETLIIERGQEAVEKGETLERFKGLRQNDSSHSLKEKLIELMKGRNPCFEPIINAVEECFASPLTEGTSSVPIKHLNKAFYPKVEVLVQNPTTGNWETKRIPIPDASLKPGDLVGSFYRRMYPADTNTPVDTIVSNIAEVTKSILSFLIKNSNSNKEFLKSNVTNVKDKLPSTIVGKETDTIDFLERDQIDVSEYPKPIVIQDWMGARLLLWYILLKYEASTRTI